MKLHLDFESRSTIDLRKTGAYVYAEHPTTDVWCCCLALEDDPVLLWVPGAPVPEEIRIMAADSAHIFVAHNAAFERIIWRHIMAPRYGWPEPKLEQWRCTMVMAKAMNLPGALDNAAAATNSPIQKDAAGERLMKQMAKPRKILPDGTIVWWDDPAKLERLYAYCKIDVEAERALEKRILQLSASELRLWHLDQRINDRGVFVDRRLANNAIRIVDAAKEKLDAEISEVTEKAVGGCTNRNELVAWIRSKGLDVESVAKDQIEIMLSRSDLDSAVRRALELRREGAKASTAKVDSLLAGVSHNGRAKGLLQFLGAGATGRWAGRRFQPQNIVRPTLKDIDTLVEVILKGDVSFFEMMYDNPLSAVGDSIRSMVTAGKGNKLLAADFANIEGRVAAWYAGEQWKIDAFKAYDRGEGPDMYKLAYSRSFAVPVEKVDKDKRQVGKVEELSLQYQGGHGAFATMAITYGVDLDALAVAVKGIVDADTWAAAEKRYRVQTAYGMCQEVWTAIRIVIDNWRAAHPNIKQAWKDLEEAAICALESPGQIFSVSSVRFRKRGSFLFMQLPSGRSISFPYPSIKPKLMPWTETKKVWNESLSTWEDIEYEVYKDCLCYKGEDSVTRQWTDQYAYGGQLFNYVVQGTARDILAEAMERVEGRGYYVILTVHDEIVSETKADHGSSEHFNELMSVAPAWAEGCPIAAEGWQGFRYRKA